MAADGGVARAASPSERGNTPNGVPDQPRDSRLLD